MNTQEAREHIIDAFEAANVSYSRGTDYRDDIESGMDITLDAFNIDSLALMEICIAIEVNVGTTITPDELSSMQYLNELVLMVAERS